MHNEHDEQHEQPKGRGIYLLPNLFTVTALLAGFYAVVTAMKGNFENAAIAIFVAMVMDNLDGRIARLTNTQTAFGAQFDSLSDMLCFGIAPALVVYSWSIHALGKPGWLAAFIFMMATALRLARFNTQIGKMDKRYFQGLSSPGGAGVIAGLVWVGESYEWHNYHAVAVIVAIFTVFVGLLMVSNIPYRSFKDFDIRGKVPFIAIVVVVLVYALISIDPPEVLFAMFLLYMLSGPVGLLWHRFRKRRFIKKG